MAFCIVCAGVEFSATEGMRFDEETYVAVVDVCLRINLEYLPNTSVSKSFASSASSAKIQSRETSYTE